MQIKEATIHRLMKAEKTKGAGSVKQKHRSEPLPIDETLKAVCADLLNLYTKLANNNGTLGVNQTTHLFPVRLREYLNRQLAFQDFTLTTLDLIEKEMEKSFLSNGGYALFLRYEQSGSDFMLIAMLKLKPGAGINEENMSLEPALTIDMNLLNEAARINITRWDATEDPYLTFIKGRSKKGDVTDYFRDALACQNYTKSSHHTDQVIKAADAFVNDLEDLTDEQKKTERIAVHTRLHRTFAENPDEVRLATLAAAIYPTAPEDFVAYVKTGPRSTDFQIDDAFKPHKATFRRLQRITGTMGTVAVGFDVGDVWSGRVYYEEKDDLLVVKSPSDKLRKAIIENGSPST